MASGSGSSPSPTILQYLSAISLCLPRSASGTTMRDSESLERVRVMFPVIRAFACSLKSSVLRNISRNSGRILVPSAVTIASEYEGATTGS